MFVIGCLRQLVRGALARVGRGARLAQGLAALLAAAGLLPFASGIVPAMHAVVANEQSDHCHHCPCEQPAEPDHWPTHDPDRCGICIHVISGASALLDAPPAELLTYQNDAILPLPRMNTPPASRRWFVPAPRAPPGA